MPRVGPKEFHWIDGASRRAPVGLQLAGRCGEDLSLLRVAAAAERLIGL